MAIVLLALVLLSLFLWWRRRNLIEVDEGGVSQVRKGDRDMDKAIGRARENFHFFVERLRNPQPGDENFGIKAGITHEGVTEHIWLVDVSVDDAGFEGAIGNEPRSVPYNLGDHWRGSLQQLTDWTFMSHGRMQGNFTLRAMMPRMPREQQREARLMLESRWDTHELAHLPWPRDAAMPGQPLSDAISHGDSALMDGVSKHLETHFGPIPRVFHELVSPSAHIDLYPYPADASRAFHVIATTGMAEQAMQLPEDSTADTHVELVLLLPASWSLDEKNWQHDESGYWPFRWLKRVARFHYESGHWLGAGHVLMHDDPPLPIDPSCAFDSVLLAPPTVLPESFQRAALADGRSVRFLQLYFLDPAARAEIRDQGWQSYLARQPDTRLSL